MDHNKFRRRTIKLGVTFVLFLISLFVFNIILNKGKTDMTAEMSKASLPVVYMNVNDEYINPLHGYTTEMEGNYLRGPITPLMANRSVTFRADLYDAVIAKVSYEVRPLDMSRLIEETEVSDFSYEGDVIYATATLKDLIEDDTEYMLIIKLTTSGGDIIRYYARVINRAELYLSEKMEFVRDFSDRTFDKEQAESIRKNMETNADGDNSSYAYVNIHSNFNQLTWGELEPVVITDKDMEILEIDETTASIMLKYQVEIMSETHNVSEFFRLQRGKRMYLMEYERIMDQVFDPEKNVVVNGKILHGMIHEKPAGIENDAGTIYAFVQQNALYSYNTATNTMARIFAFSDKDNNDARTRYNAHSIKPMIIDGVGNIWFVVYGYMNRGINEGKVGVALYYYDCTLNTVEEELFIPYTKSYEMLSVEVEKLAYLSTRNRMYIFIDGGVYTINISAVESDIMQGNISETGFFSSGDESIIAWQTESPVIERTLIQMFRLDSMTPYTIPAGSGEVVVPLGFIDNDMIYGCARVSDITTDYTGRTIIPMYSVRIQDRNGNVLKDYRQEGVYVLGVERSENMLILSRAAKDPESGQIVPIEDDQIVNNKTQTTLRNKLSSVVTDLTETTYQTVLFKGGNEEHPSVKVTSPREVVFEGSREVPIRDEDTLKRYYVYAKGRIAGIYTSASEAVEEAERLYGVITDKQMAYIWESSNRRSSAGIAGLDLEVASPENAVQETDDATAYIKCIDVMLQSGGVYKSSEDEIGRKSLVSVLQDNLEADVLDLSGVSLTDVLYYVSRGYPVMAMTGQDTAVIITGYDSRNTVIYDPKLGGTYKLGLNDSKELFERAGNRFITYIR